MDWQPIETAPKDETEILVYSRSKGRAYIATWNAPWNAFLTVPGRYSLPGPRYWMPLPTPPEAP